MWRANGDLAAAMDGAISLEYRDWCAAGGIRLCGVDAGFVDEGWRGVVATEEKRKGGWLRCQFGEQGSAAAWR